MSAELKPNPKLNISKKKTKHFKEQNKLGADLRTEIRGLCLYIGSQAASPLSYILQHLSLSLSLSLSLYLSLSRPPCLPKCI